MTVDLGSLSPDGRWQVADALMRSRSAVMAQLCELVVAVDAAGDWEADGSSSLSEWVARVGSITPAVARQVVVTARRLASLPALGTALAAGDLSWEQVVPAARLATATTDERLARELVGVAPTSIELMARTRRERPVPDRSGPWVRARRDGAGDGVHVHCWLPTVPGAQLTAVLDHLARRAGPDPETGAWAPIDRRRGDALGELVAAHAATDAATATAVRSQVVVHAEAAVIDTGDGAGRIGLSVVDPHGVNQALCDAELTWVLHDGEGEGIGIARMGREAPAWLARRILDRDLTCRFPGCDHRVRELHHVRWWSKGGETTSDNLAGLCWTHHRAVHRGGWLVSGNADRELVFTSPRLKRRFASRARPEWIPPRTTPEVHHRVRVHLAPAAARTNSRSAA
ncbi:MAG TPA: DUF222 domain-containing protein [Acidimicrobiales bacterium]|nr:DUF222 domain-containing protein [Acidimicrobiales bacterium]